MILAKPLAIAFLIDVNTNPPERGLLNVGV